MAGVEELVMQGDSNLESSFGSPTHYLYHALNFDELR